MIRKNYSLADELRKQETRRQKKVQDRQKYNHKSEKLKHVDVNDLYRRINALKAKPSKTPQDFKYLKSLEDDWSFITKNNLHSDATKKINAQIEKEQVQKQALAKKLWGEKSVYFNPELNPLGKVPDSNKLPQLTKTIENHTIPIKHKKEYPQDPLIKSLNITPPNGAPPKFYKKVYNTGRSHITSVTNEPKRPKTGQ